MIDAVELVTKKGSPNLASALNASEHTTDHGTILVLNQPELIDDVISKITSLGLVTAGTSQRSYGLNGGTYSILCVANP